MSSKHDAGSFLDAFKAGFETGRIAHAYLLVGDTSGNALRFAERMLCVLSCKSSAARPCLECPGCRKTLQRAHPDMMWIEPEKKSRTIQKGQVEAIEERVYHTSYEGGWKAIVLVDADRMNDVVANALLKAMEEPPKGTVFLLLTAAPDSLLPTVLSRCHRIIVRDAENVPTSGGAGRAAKKAPETSSVPAMQAAVAGMIRNHAYRGGGVIVGMARARALLDILKKTKKAIEADETSRDSEAQSGSEGGEETKDVAAGRIEARYVAARDELVRGLLLWCRDMLLAVSGADSESFCFKDEHDVVMEMSAGLTWRQAAHNMRIVEDMKIHLDQHISENMVFERAMTELKLGS